MPGKKLLNKQQEKQIYCRIILPFANIYGEKSNSCGPA
ncbi:hypothetical protein KKC1_22900 [Calderihabitans maritimus]|uniref:Uncharacterized protein n=1 Tax=Calderihabitans maritimus TaxID=1246530 RepID=A0A1Z5HUD7_9FIRM|nr:hypothetical protein KKC1_22900 [Calderihabitans maritimus]